MPEPPTSTSSHRAPASRWGLIWSVALVALLGALILAEVWLRSIGLSPMIEDDARLWALWREQLAEPSQRTRVVLVGTSRMQLGVDPAVVQEALGDEYEVINLSTNASSPVPVLDHLAHDARFSGVVISGLHPRAIFAEMTAWEDKAAGWIDFYENRAWIDDVETRLRLLFQQRLALMRSDSSPLQIVSLLLKFGRLPEPSYIAPRYDRFLAADYTKVPEKKLEKRTDEYSPDILRSDEELVRRMEAIRDDVRTIEGRGGQVFFIRMVTSGGTLEAERELCPREHYFDEFVAAIPEATFIHYADDPVLSEFECPDGGHLDYRDAGPYTRRLAELVAAQID
jgi:hypothetical protein